MSEASEAPDGIRGGGTPDDGERVLVAGGGIAGLAAALGLARQGRPVLVLESRADFTELGAGIQLAPNAFRALDRLGAGAAVRARAVHIGELRFMDGTTGRPVARLPLDDAYRERFGGPYAVVHRNDLYAPLLAACRAACGVRLRTGARVADYAQDGSGVSVRLAGGERVRGAALVGADGIRSAVRRRLVGDGRPRVSGHTIHRAVIPIARVPAELRVNAATLWAGPGWHLVHYPIGPPGDPGCEGGGGRFLNLAATRDDGATEELAGVPAARAHVLARFPGIAEVPRRLLGLGRDWRTWVLCDRDPVPRWSEGRVVLVGDAAHPMLQYAAQGACQALEDAVVLGELAAGVPSGAELAGAFTKFVAARRERTAAAQLVARELGHRLYHPSGEDAVRRNALLSGLTAADLRDRIAWLHGGFGDGPDAGDDRHHRLIREEAHA